jgi:hypothetical protein
MAYGKAMIDAANRQSAGTRSSIAVLAVLAAGFLFRFLPLLFWHSIAQADEVFQSIEQGHRLVYGYGLVPWEFDYAARSWLLAYLSAGAMRLSDLFGGGPQIYLPLIAALLSALGAVTTLCTFQWARRFMGMAAGIAAALVSASWVDNIFFGGRTLTEAVAANLFVIAIYLAEPGYRVEHRGRLLAAGLFAGAAFVLRIHLAPAIALLWLWRGLDARRFLFLSLGALLIVACSGVFDALTWDYPFEPIWLNIKFNLLQHGSQRFGTAPWWDYFYQMGANWGGTIAIFLPLAFLGGRRVPFVLVSAFVIVIVHSFIGHKEYRFIYPAILLFSIAAGIGAVDAVRFLTHGWKDGARNPARPLLAGLCAACWALLAFVNLIGRDYEKNWDHGHHSADAALYVSRMAGVCGIGLTGMENYDSGGYTLFHKRVPLYWAKAKSSKVMEKSAAFNVLLYVDKRPGPSREHQSPFPSYRSVACFKDVCVARRPGACIKLPTAPRPVRGTINDDTPENYPYVAGVD